MRTFNLRINGMHCNGCAQRLTQVLTGVRGVRAARVSYEQAEARLVIDPELTTQEILVAVVAKAGFTATPSNELKR